MHIPRFFKPTIKSFNGDRRNYAKVHGVVLSGENKNNAYHLLQDLKQIYRSLWATYEFARARKIGKFNEKIATLRQIRKLYFSALFEELTATFDVAKIALVFVVV
jgi:hypothetical protein